MNDRKGLVVAMVIAAFFVFTWQPLIHWVENRTGVQLMPRPEIAATRPTENTSPAAMPNVTGPTTGPGAAVGATQPTTTTGGLQVAAVSTTQPARVVIGSGTWKDPTYALAMDVATNGGGLVQVALNQYAEQVGTTDAFRYQIPINGGPLPLSTRSVTINGQTRDLTAAVWRVQDRSEAAVTLALDLQDNGEPLLTLTKTFKVDPADAAKTDGPQGYDTDFSFGYVNHTPNPVVVSTVLNGPTFLPSENLRGGDRSVVAGFRGKNTVVLKHDALEGFSGSGATKDYTQNEGDPLLWLGTNGNYFNAIVRPTGTEWIKAAGATVVNPEQTDTAQRQVAIAMTTADVTLPPNGTHTNAARVYFGPRQRNILNNAYYSAPDLSYYHTLETSGYCALCTFQWLVGLLMSLLTFFHFVLRDWGLAIIALVFVVRTLLHPITKRSQINMAKMGKMGPEIEKIKKKYGDDKEGMNAAMMQFYKTQGATPILGCLPMFLQMPIWIALYTGLGSTFELRQAPFLSVFGHDLTWIHDLSQPDHLIHFRQTITFFFLHIDGLNVIPILLAGAFFLQQKFTPKPPATTPEQEQQQKMMQWMSLLFPVMLYSSPSGLNLYILTSTTFGIIESRIIRKHIKDREAIATAGPTFVDAEVVRPRITGTSAAAAVKPAGGLFGIWRRLQDQIERAKQEAEKKARENRR